MNIENLRVGVAFDHARKVYREHVGKYEEKFGLRNSTSGPKEWQPFRICTRDMVLAMIVLRKDVRNNAIEVDTCIIENIPQIEDHFSTMVALSVMISEAFQRVTKMEIRFTKNVERQRVPLRICEYARKVGLKLKHVADGILLPSEVRLLYLSITELSRLARSKAIALHESREISVERICFMVQNGIWTKEEMESILLGHPNPASLLLGRFTVEYRVPFLIDGMYARLAILGGAVDRIMRSIFVGDESYRETLENDREVSIHYDGRHHMKIYRCMDEEIKLPWRVWDLEDYPVISRGDMAFVRLLPRSKNEMQLLMSSDIRDYSNEIIAFSSNMAMRCRSFINHFFVVTSDFQDMDIEERKKISDQAREKHFRILIFPHSVKFLDEQGLNKMTMSRRLRR